MSSAVLGLEESGEAATCVYQTLPSASRGRGTAAQEGPRPTEIDRQKCPGRELKGTEAGRSHHTSGSNWDKTLPMTDTHQL